MSDSEKKNTGPTDTDRDTDTDKVGSIKPAPHGEPQLTDAPLDHDARFDAPEWQHWPFNLIYRNYLLTQQHWLKATSELDTASRRDSQALAFAAQQMLGLMSPSNLLWTNPEVLAHTLRAGGLNLFQGAQNMAQDWASTLAGQPPVGSEHHQPGRDVAVTPGKVIWRSHLLELIQYAPQTDRVAAEPILIVPAWIMKYYILDLSPQTSFVRYLVAQGFSVFMISWRNPDGHDRDLGMDDYLTALDEALDAVGATVPDAGIHAIGYCLGGTLLSIKAAELARAQDQRLKTLTLFAARTDFEDRGALELLLNQHSLPLFESMMSDRGYWDTRQAVDALKLMQPNDFIWPLYIKTYLMGQRQPLSDMAAWGSDTTRMPYRMHSEYLRRIVLGNELAQGRYEVKGAPVSISAISVPVFCVATSEDHVAPCDSVYKLHALVKTDLTFVLTSGGHVDGIVTDPASDAAHYQIATTPADAARLTPEGWRAQAPHKQGAWWPELAAWLQAHSSKAARLPRMGGQSGADQSFDNAPGTYVFQR